MKEIKFRAWDKFNGQYWYSDNFPNLAKFFTAIQSLIDGENGIILEQYIDLPDINGKDVYKGDIVAVNIAKVIPEENPEVRYDKGGTPVIMNIKTGEHSIKGRTLYEIIWQEWGCCFQGEFIRHEPDTLKQDLGCGTLFLHTDNKHNKLNIEIIGNIRQIKNS